MNTTEMKKIVELYKLYLETNGKKGKLANLSNAYLRYANLSNAYLRYANLSNTNLSGANLSYADLSEADLRNAYLRYANLSNTNLRNAYLRGANLSNADLSNANLSYADLSNANLSNANLSNASFKNTLYKGIKINVTPKIIITNIYDVILFENHIKIGCKFYSTKEWENFSNKEILEMDDKKGLKFWKQWKNIIIETSKLHNQ